MAKAKDVSAPILTGTAGTESALTGIDLQSKAAFENALRAEGMDAAVEKFIQENPDSFLTPKESAQLEAEGPETFWPKYNTLYSSNVTNATNTTGTVNKSTITPTFTATDGTAFFDEKSYREYQDYIDGKRAARQSAFDLLYEQFSNYGLGSLVEPIRALITDSSVSPSEYTIRLRQTDAYKKRFAANAQRVAKGLTALSEGDYLAYEDRYQRIMRNYGLPASYYEKGDLGVQKNFENLIANDVRDDELLDRISTAYDRVINAAPEVSDTLKTFYPGITNGDILAYVLDPQNGIKEIQRKVTAAEIGGAAKQFGLAATLAGAESLANYGVTQQQARQGYQNIAEILPRGSQLASIYKQEPYTQTTAESEVFGTPGAADAAAKRKKLAQLEQGSFSGSAGTSNAISRDRAGSF